MSTPAADAAWSALFPAGTVWLGPGRAGGAGLAAAPAAWAAARPRPPAGRRAYLAVPSPGGPLIVTRWDGGVLRYLAGSVLTVPPGAGPLLSPLLTAGLRLLRHPGTWVVAALLGRGGVLVVRAPR